MKIMRYEDMEAEGFGWLLDPMRRWDHAHAAGTPPLPPVQPRRSPLHRFRTWLATKVKP